MTSPNTESERLIAFPSLDLLPDAFVFRTRSLTPKSTIQSLFVNSRLSAASKQVIDMRIMLQRTNNFLQIQDHDFRILDIDFMRSGTIYRKINDIYT